MTSEEWLREAVTQIDNIIFSGELDSANHDYQIYFGRVKGKRGAETVQPSDNEDITLDDFFPTTIGIDYTSDVDDMLAHLAQECIRAFLGLTKGKAFKKKCIEYYFDAPYSEAHPTPYLRDQLQDVHNAVEKICGEFPGKKIKFPVKEKKEKKPTRAVFFCPECGLEFSTPINKLKGATGTPTCICGAKCGRDLSDEENSDSSQENSENKD
jgi:hypothetical protein